MHYMDNVSRLFRDKVKAIFNGGGSAASPTTSRIAPAAAALPGARNGISPQNQVAFDEVDALYDKALSAWEDENAAHEPLPAYGSAHMGNARGGGSASQDADFTEYWKQKHAEAEVQIEKLRNENDNMIA